MTTRTEAVLTVNQNKNRFECDLKNGITGIVKYELDDDVMRLTYSEVPKDIRGNGYGKAMVKKTLNHIERMDKKVEPKCDFVEHVMDENPHWDHLRS